MAAEFPVCGDLLDLDSIKDEDLFGTIDESPIGSTSLLSFDDIGKPAASVPNVQTFLPVQGTRTPGGRKIVFSDKENQSPDSPAFRYTEKPALTASVLKRKFESIIGSSYMTTTGLHGRSGLRDHTNLLSPIRPISAEVSRCTSLSLSPLADIELSTSPLVAIQPLACHAQGVHTHNMQETGTTSQAMECPTPAYSSTAAAVSAPSCPSLAASSSSIPAPVSALAPPSNEVTAVTSNMVPSEALHSNQKSVIDTIFEMDDEEQLSSLQPSRILSNPMPSISQPPASNIPAAPATATTVTQPPPPPPQNISRLKAPSSVSIKRLLSPNRSVRQTIRRVDSNMSDQEEPAKRIKLDSTSAVAGGIGKSSAIPIPSRLRPLTSQTNLK
eukprot:GILK01006725.1.p1 GENE.GILK01006725.1~~GILK01006725.1.p1  ORF type:complete len:398 (-),score=65.93 GILK01006725.1:273-1427(-)